MQRRTGRKFKGHRAQATLVRQFAGMNAHMIFETTRRQKGLRTILTQNLTDLRVRQQVIIKIVFALKATLTNATTMLIALSVDHLMSLQ